jgi:tRNA pseudouridine38-40 synthase
MVRAIVGTLVEVGLNKISVDDFNEIILAQDRSRAGKSVPAHALVLKDIEYPVNDFDKLTNGK